MSEGNPISKFGEQSTRVKTGKSTGFQVLGTLGSLVTHTLIAIFVVASITAPVTNAFHAASIAAILDRAYISSIVFGLSAGFLVYRIIRDVTARWIWGLPLLCLLLKALLVLGASLNFENTWSAVSGRACMQAGAKHGCELTFFAFTIPFLRCVSYASGTVLAARLGSRGPTPYSLFRESVRKLNRS
jgi:hypothetical protein